MEKVEMDSIAIDNIAIPSKPPAAHKTVHFAESPADDEFKTGIRFTPKITRPPQFKNVEERQALLVSAPPNSASQQGSLSKPNYEDILRRVSIVIHQHVKSCEEHLKKLTPETSETGLFHSSQKQKFAESNFVSPQFVCHFVRVPLCKLGFLCGVREAEREVLFPRLEEVHQFVSNLFIKAQLSAECSIVCLIYVERLMELANVPLCSETWRPILLCGLLLASKVWQDLSSWNSEFAQVYPQFPLQAITRLESLFCREIQWDLYISSSSYAKYYFALRSLTEKRGFRSNYAAMMVNAPNAQQVQERSGGIKQHFLSTVLSKSL